MTPEEKKNKRHILNRELPVFAFFLLLSFVFWYLNELGKELEGTINYPVRYINPPKDRIIIGDLPDKMEMNLRGPGYSILKMKLSGSRAPVVIDLTRVAPKRIPGSTPHYYLVTSGLIQNFGKQLHADFEILSIHPDTLFFGYDRLVTRRMAVLPDLQMDAPPGTKVVLVPDPDSITVTGPEHVLDTLSGISTQRRSFTRMEGNFRVRVSLKYPEYLETTQRRVSVEVTLLDRDATLFTQKDIQRD